MGVIVEPTKVKASPIDVSRIEKEYATVMRPRVKKKLATFDILRVFPPHIYSIVSLQGSKARGADDKMEKNCDIRATYIALLPR